VVCAGVAPSLIDGVMQINFMVPAQSGYTGLPLTLDFEGLGRQTGISPCHSAELQPWSRNPGLTMYERGISAHDRTRFCTRDCNRLLHGPNREQARWLRSGVGSGPPNGVVNQQDHNSADYSHQKAVKIQTGDSGHSEPVE
jgi:hypothetical protein